MSKLADFLSELKRRRVYRVAAVYAGVAFIICQIVDATFESVGIPIWGERFVFILLAVGFPIAVGMAWAFDLTEEGLVKTKSKREAAATKTPHPMVGNKTLAIIAVLAIIVAVWALIRGPSQPGGSVIRSLAVLPLHNLSGDPEQEYIADGMHDQLISALCGINAIEVRGRQSTLQYKNSEKTIPVITSELNVDALVESSVLPLGERVRITVQLVDSQDRHLWENTYDRNLEDVFALYDEVTRAIVQEIRATLTLQEEERLASAPQVNSEAWKLYTKGWELRLLEGSENITNAIKYLEQAVELDSTFAPAWAALAATCYGRDRARMFEALDRALELDPDNVVALTWQAITQYNWMREGAIRSFAGAEASFHRALELEPGNVYARYEYGQFLYRYGQPHEALAEFRLAQDLDPANPLPLRGFAWVYNSIRQYDQLLEYCRDYSELTGEELTYFKTQAEIGILMEQGRYAEVAEQMGIDTGWGRRARMAMADTEEVYAYIDSVLSSEEYERENPFGAAGYYAFLKDKDKALSLLEQAFVNVNQSAMSLHYNTDFDFLRAEPRYKALTQRHAANFPGAEWMEVFDENGNLIKPIDETLEAYNAPGSR